MCIDDHVKLQEKLLDKAHHSNKPDEEFLQSFAALVGSEWTSLAASLSLSKSKMEEVRTQKGHAAAVMMKMWASREDATYGQLRRKLLY